MEILGWKFNVEKADPNKELIDAIDNAIEHGGWAAAKEVCRNTKGNAATMGYQMIELFEKYKS